MGGLGKRDKALDTTAVGGFDFVFDIRNIDNIPEVRAHFRTILRIWTTIVVYSQLIIWLSYTWALSSSPEDQNRITRLFGLPDDGVPKNFLYLLPYIVAYYSAAIQLIASRFVISLYE